MKKVAKIILVNPDNKILLALRDNKQSIPYPNHWDEIGGRIEESETPLAALKREIKEEISCEIFNIELIGITSDNNSQCKIYLFRGEFREKLENLHLSEGQKLGLFSFEELKYLLISPPLKEHILKNKNKIILKTIR